MDKKKVVELQELHEVMKKEKGLLILSGILTLVVIMYLSLKVLLPSIWGKISLISIAFLAFASLILTFLGTRTIRYLGEFSQKEFRELAFLDELTGVYNYRYIERRLNFELERTKKFSSPLSLIYIDIDHFKKVNDVFGHETGNKVLKEASRLLKDSVREMDIVGRVGGDEFLVILPLSTIDEAFPVANRLKENFSSQAFECSKEKKIDFLTLSLGVVSSPPLPPDRVTLIKEADTAMYRAKKEGGNRASL